MDQARAFPVSWDQFHRDCRALAWRLSPLGPFSAMVTVTRGGLVPAAIVARELSIRVIETVSIESYHGGGGAESTQGAPEVLKGMAPELSAGRGAGILVVDDLVDTGQTARVMRDLLPQAHFATVYAKPARPPPRRHLRHGGLAGYLDLFSLGSRPELPDADCGRIKGEAGVTGRSLHDIVANVRA